MTDLSKVVQTIRGLMGKATPDWRLQRYGVIVGGAVESWAMGERQSQIAMFVGSENISSAERDTNSALAVELHNNASTLLDAIERLEREVAELKVDAGALQAEIDRLMLEYCPDEMTQTQIDNWGAHQVSVPE